MMNRRNMIVGAIGAGAAVLCGPAFAQTQSRSVDAAKVFPKLKEYLDLPAADRSHFGVAFVLKLDGAAPGSAFSLQTDAGSRPLIVDAAGVVANLPTEAELRNGAVVIVQSAGKASSTMALKPTLSLSLSIDAADAARAVAQVNRAIGRFAGALGAMAPKMKGIGFTAPATAAGVAVLADGKRTPLKFRENAFEFLPGSAKKVARIEFLTAPSAVAFI